MKLHLYAMLKGCAYVGNTKKERKNDSAMIFEDGFV